KARRILGEIPGIINRKRNSRLNATRTKGSRAIHPRIKVFATMAWCRMHKARTRVVGNVIPCQQRHRKRIATANTLQRMRNSDSGKIIGTDSANALELQLCLGESLLSQRIGKDQLLASLRTKIIF